MRPNRPHQGFSFESDPDEMDICVAANLTFDWHFFWHFVFHPSHALLKGLEITLYSSVIAQLAGMTLGVLSALAALSRRRAVRLLSAAYVLFFRGTPLLVQMFLVYFGTPYLFGVDLFPLTIDILGAGVPGAVVAGIVALSINEGAYMSEIFRGGILAVPKGQVEAAKALGMRHRTLLRHVVLPQALRIVVPPLGNEFNSLLKLSSLMSVIGVTELFRVAEGVNSATFKSFEVFFGIALYYVVLTGAWTIIQSLVERRLGRHTASAATRRPLDLVGRVSQEAR